MKWIPKPNPKNIRIPVEIEKEVTASGRVLPYIVSIGRENIGVVLMVDEFRKENSHYIMIKDKTFVGTLWLDSINLTIGLRQLDDSKDTSDDTNNEESAE